MGKKTEPNDELTTKEKAELIKIVYQHLKKNPELSEEVVLKKISNACCTTKEQILGILNSS